MRWLTLMLKNLYRRPVRLGLTAAAVMVAILVFVTLRAFDLGLEQMIRRSGDDLVLVVFEKYKACPAYSRMPVHYADQIRNIEGVRDAMPVRILMAACRPTSQPVVIHGIEPQRLRAFRKIDVDAETYARFEAERGTALVGAVIADKYGWQVGDTVSLPRLRGISFTVGGIYAATGNSLDSVILLDREYVEQASGDIGQTTMFLASVNDASRLDQVSEAIDAEFANSASSTETGPEKAFLSTMMNDFRDLVRFAQIIAYAALGLLVLAVANSMSINVRERLREMAIQRTIGYRTDLLLHQLTGESILIGLLGAGLGCMVAFVALVAYPIQVGVESFVMYPSLNGHIVFEGLLAGIGLGLVGGIFPAWRGARMPVLRALKEVD